MKKPSVLKGRHTKVVDPEHKSRTDKVNQDEKISRKFYKNDSMSKNMFEYIESEVDSNIEEAMHNSFVCYTNCSMEVIEKRNLLERLRVA